MSFSFTKAVKTKAKLRMAIYGPSGSGKTWTALALATGLAAGGKIAVLDTEHGSASKYADKFDFDALELSDFHPQNYIDAISAAEGAGYTVLVIDSLSHAWAGKGGALELVDKAARKSASGNSYVAWKDITPLQNTMIDKIIGANLHVIATMRSKNEYSQEKDDRGKTIIRKIGVEPIQRKEMEYEMDIVGVMDQSNTMIIEKSRMSELSGAIIEKPGAKLAAQIDAWLNAGSPVAAAVQSDQQRWVDFCKQHQFGAADIEKALGTRSVKAWMESKNASIDAAMNSLLNWAVAESDKTRQAAGK